jgi:hypothetical protein
MKREPGKSKSSVNYGCMVRYPRRGGMALVISFAAI